MQRNCRQQQFRSEPLRRITDAVFHILRNAGTRALHDNPNLIVCWGGHSIEREEYDYTKEVGYDLGLRGLDVCTAAGPAR